VTDPIDRVAQGGQLLDHLGAFAASADHRLDSPSLALDPAQSLDQILLSAVFVHLDLLTSVETHLVLSGRARRSAEASTTALRLAGAGAGECRDKPARRFGAFRAALRVGRRPGAEPLESPATRLAGVLVERHGSATLQRQACACPGGGATTNAAHVLKAGLF